ncbi:MAG TPA: hypothetical protein V6D28_11325 [Leptolyngbyaceae cyanobacterium]
MKIKTSLLKVTGCAIVPIAVAGLTSGFFNPEVNAQPTAIAQNVNRDEPLDVTLNQRFSLANSLDRIQQIRGALNSFRTLTERSKTALGQRVISSVGNTEPDIQTLGFTNWVGAVEGTVRGQNYRIKKLEFELAQKQFEDKQISQAAFNQKRTAYQQAQREFQNFVNSFRIAD